jgi:hypothetical protein
VSISHFILIFQETFRSEVTGALSLGGCLHSETQCHSSCSTQQVCLLHFVVANNNKIKNLILANGRLRSFVASTQLWHGFVVVV